MNIIYDTCTKDKNKLSYCVLEYLLKLGFNPAVKGTILFRNLIVYIYVNDLEIYTIKSVCKVLANVHKCSDIVVYKSIVYSIQNIDYQKAKNNFFNVLNVEYNINYLMPKSLATLIKNKLDRNI